MTVIYRRRTVHNNLTCGGVYGYQNSGVNFAIIVPAAGLAPNGDRMTSFKMADGISRNLAVFLEGNCWLHLPLYQIISHGKIGF